MKSLVFNLTVALVVLTNVNEGSYNAKREARASRNENPVSLLSQINFFEQESYPEIAVSTGLKHNNAVAFNHVNHKVKSNEGLTSIRIEAVSEHIFSKRSVKTTEEIIAEDNAITESSFSNETQALDFVAIENMLPARTGKTMDDVIAEDSAITENSFSDETQVLDFVAIENMLPARVEGTVEDVIAADNQIIESNSGNETQALDFNVINSKLLLDVTIDNVAFNKSEKTMDEIIAEDHQITEYNGSNGVQPLQLYAIN